MNGYLRSKCSSEQQLLNELAKLLGAKDVTSRKMADVLRALTFFYTSAGRGSRIPLSLLSGLCTLLPQLKDKKEITLLKDEHQRIARIALCLLSRLIDQFEIQKEMTTGSNLSQDQSVDPAEQVLANFLLTLETAVMTPSGMLLPRQRATLRVYAQLCRIFLKREQLVTYTAALLQQSPVLTYAENHVDAKGKRLPPPVPAQFGAVAGACHAVRFNTEPDDQVFVANKLAQLTFMVPAGTASRHAAKTLLSLLTSPVLNEGRPSNAITVAKAIELYLLKARPRTLLGGDSLTSVYLLRLCGQMARLPAHHQQQQEIPATNDSQHFNITSTLLETSSDIAPEKAHDRNSALQGFLVSHALSIQLQEYLVDVIQAAVADDSSTKAGVVPAVLLVAVEETLRGTSPEDSFRQQPNWGSKCIFELVAAALLPLLPAPQDPARLLCSTVTLHRVCRAVQFVAERLDAAVLHFGVATGQKMEIPTYLSQLTLRVHSLTEHSNAFIACEALRGFVWLLPRYSINTEQNGSIENHWTSIFWQLEALPLGRVQPERRAAIAWTIFRRCVTTLKSYGYEVEKPLLLGCLRVVLAWFRVRPCVWHAALLTAIWHTTLRECLVAPLGEAVFASINEVLDYQCSPTDNGATDSLIVKQSTLQFLSNREGCLKHVVRREEWCRPLILRLTKQVLLESSTSQRLGFRALSQLGDEADAQGLTSLAQQAKAILSFTEKLPRQAQRKGLTTGDEFQNQPFSIHDELLPGVKAQGGALDDPFSDFRAPDGAIASANKALEDPFADPIECATTSDVFNWNSATSTTSKVTATVSTSITDLQIPADHSFGDSTWYNPTAFNETKTEAFGESSQFSAWGDESDIQNIPPQRTIQETLFGNFTASETTSFDDWGGGGTTEPQQEGFIANEDFSGSFDAAISTPAMTTESESDIAGQTAQTDEASPADVPDVPIADEDPVAIASPDTTAAAGMVSDAQSEAANFSTAETTSFDDWGGGGTTEPQQEGFIANEDFSGSFDAAISTPAMTTESESDIAGQTAQTDEASPADVPDVPIADEDPVAIASLDSSALTPCADLDFDDIFGETGGFAKPSVEFQTDNAIENTIVPTGIIPVDQCDDLEFNDIFGDNAGAGNGAFPAPGGSGAYGDMISTTTEHGSKEKDLNASGNEDRTASGIEVRSGTPASDFYASFTTDSLKQ